MRRHAPYLYLLLIIAGCIFIIVRSGTPDVRLVAAEDLPPNHLVNTGDLLWRADGSQYVTRQVEKGGDVALREIASAPDIDPRKGMEPVAVPVAGADVANGTINAGKHVHACPLKIPAEVRAVFCGPGRVNCLAVVEVAAAERKKVIEDAPKSTFALKSAC